ncbi:hypothetical protein ACOMHN_062758 [Nucella lapillus]
MAHTGAVLLMKVKQEAPDLDTFMNVKTEPCNLPDTPLDSPGSSNLSDTRLSSSPGPSKPNNRNLSDPTLASPGPSSQGRRPKPYSLRLKPFTAVDSPDVGDLHIGSHQTGLDVVFKTEPLSESGLEQDSEAVMLKEQWASGVEAGGVVREIKAEQMCDVCHDSRSLLASQNGLDVSVCSALEHRKKHEEDRKCKECNVVLSRADDMKKHMRVHTEDKPYQCPLCPAQFRQAGHLSTHHLQHTDSKPFACDQCGCGFKQSHHLKRHLRVHQGQGCLSCPLCSASFERESSLTRHRQKCHKSAASGATT